ncbi:MAG: hypothetical protein ABIQ49_00450, partial [Gemmatimonadales bacterium]
MEPHRPQEQQHAGRDQQPRVEPLGQAAHQGHGKRAGDGAGKDDLARIPGGIAQQVLQEDRQREHAGIEREAEHHREADARSELAVPEDAEIDDGVLGPELVPDESHDPESRRDRLDHDLARLEPVPALTPLEQDLQRADP